VYAAIPSLHSAYVPVALYYSFRTKPSISWITVLSVVTIGIWISAVYSGHHYIIDVILGIMCSVLGIIVFEYVLMRIPIVKNGYKKICAML
jgi:membrane-associated phospholipid phosphatase